jgi:hypothetical protein
MPQFKKGDVVYDLWIKDSRGVVVNPGPEVSEVKLALKGNRIDPVSNRYLIKLDEPSPFKEEEEEAREEGPAKAKAPTPAKKPAPAKAPAKAKPPVKSKGKKK